MDFPIYYGNERVAFLTMQSEGVHGQYDDAWIASKEAFPISLSLPLSSNILAPESLLPWLANLLPEGDPFRAMTRALGVAPEDVLGLIERTGADLAGALRVGGPRVADHPDYRVIATDTDLEKILDDLPAKPFLVGEEGVSMSLAGAQEKLPVAVIEGRIAVPVNGAPSTHILKPDNLRLADSVINEALCMVLAKRCGLPVAEVTIGHAGKRSYLLVERYDRKEMPPGIITRIHQEDFCQATSRLPSAKYERNRTGVTGPSLAEMFSLVRDHMTALEITRLLDAVIFNVAIGNVDSHAKNYSIMLEAGGTKLAPLYDLMTGLAWAGITENHAQSIGGQVRGRHIYAKHWRRMAEACGLSPSGTVRRVQAMTRRILAELPAAKHEVAKMQAKEVMLSVFCDEIANRSQLVERNTFNDVDDNGSQGDDDYSLREERYV